MVALAILCAMTGATLGLRFTVWVLAPAIVAALALVVAVKFVAGANLSSTAIDALVATTSLQLGYVSGAAIRLFLAAARSAGASRRASIRSILRIVPPHSD
jgi:hypothetical protein